VVGIVLYAEVDIAVEVYDGARHAVESHEVASDAGLSMFGGATGTHPVDPRRCRPDR
jgi:hypothetical protein